MIKIEKQQVIEALKKITSPGEGGNLIDAEVVKNIVIFGDEIVIDVTINNPTLQAKKKIEVEIMRAIHAEIYEKAKVKVNVTVNAPEPSKPEIKGKPIDGIRNIIAVASGKGGHCITKNGIPCRGS